MKYDVNDMITIPEELNAAVQKGIANGKKIRHKKLCKQIITICGSTAAVIALSVTVCVTNPALAEKIPYIGKIFEHTQSDYEFKGDYSNYSTHLANTLDQTKDTENTDETTSQTDTIKQLEEAYGDTADNVTVIPEEVFCDGVSLYLGLRLTTTEDIGWGLAYADSEPVQNLQNGVELIGNITFGDTVLEFNHYTTGYCTDDSTYTGMIKLPVNGITDDVSQVSVHINNIFWSHYGNYIKTQESTDGTFYPYHIMKEGPWNLTVPVTIDTSRIKTFDVQDQNDAGYGIDSVRVTPYEIQVKKITPYEFVNEDGYTGGFAVFNEKGEYFQMGNGDENNLELFVVNGQSAEHLYFYFFQDEMIAVKCHDQQDAEENCIYKYDLTVSAS